MERVLLTDPITYVNDVLPVYARAEGEQVLSINSKLDFFHGEAEL